MNDTDAQFAGSIPGTYDRCLGPMFFEPYAADLVARLKLSENSSVLELACGTGIVTRHLRDRLPASTRLVATDLSEPMMQDAMAKFTGGEAIEWKQADACSLPFGDHQFDAVICQFGFMFVPDKPLCGREARRVLKPGGVFLFNVWDSLAKNPLGRIAHETVSVFFETDPPAFYQVPFGYHDQAEITHLLETAGFRDVRVETVGKLSVPTNADDAARGLVQGTPVSIAIAERDASLFPIITEAVAKAIKKELGGSPFRAPMQAIVAEARA
jgi:ubiquinone/menaquinone biosynthesis C-methylase UbiE